MNLKISDVALDLGVFELNNQLESGSDVSEPLEQLNWAQQTEERQLEEKTR